MRRHRAQYRVLSCQTESTSPGWSTMAGARQTTRHCSTIRVKHPSNPVQQPHLLLRSPGEPGRHLHELLSGLRTVRIAAAVGNEVLRSAEGRRGSIGHDTTRQLGLVDYAVQATPGTPRTGATHPGRKL